MPKKKHRLSWMYEVRAAGNAPPEDAPAAEEAPALADEEYLAVEETPAPTDKECAIEEAPAEEEYPAVEETSAPTDEECAVEEAPAEEEYPAVEGTPAEEEYPAVEETPAPTDEECAVEEAPAEEEYPAVEGTPAEEEYPAVEETPAPTDEECAVEEAPAEEEYPAVEETPAEEEYPAVEETPAPTEEEYPAVEGTPAPTEEEYPAVEETPAEEYPVTAEEPAISSDYKADDCEEETAGNAEKLQDKAGELVSICTSCTVMLFTEYEGPCPYSFISLMEPDHESYSWLLHTTCFSCVNKYKRKGVSREQFGNECMVAFRKAILSEEFMKRTGWFDVAGRVCRRPIRIMMDEGQRSVAYVKIDNLREETTSKCRIRGFRSIDSKGEKGGKTETLESFVPGVLCRQMCSLYEVRDCLGDVLTARVPRNTDLQV